MPIKVKVKGEELQEVSEHFAKLASPSFNDVLIAVGTGTYTVG